MIKFRPHKGNLLDSLRETREFANLEEMYAFLVADWSAFLGEPLFSKEDLSISENLGKDDRTDWIETRYVCTSRMGNQHYSIPQCIGMCSIE